MVALSVLGAASLAAWCGLVLARGRFFLPGPWLPRRGAEPEAGAWPAVTAIVPSKNEADLLPRTLPRLLAQRYEGPFRVVVVDDGSTDGTGDVARGTVADGMAEGAPCRVVEAGPTPEGWAGKVWALAGGTRVAAPAEWLWLTDADIAHDADVLHRLVSLALAEQLDSVSVMARLRTVTAWERLVIPAFVYFFSMLYPFRQVSGRRGRTAAAAGGCLLVRAALLDSSGGFEAMKGAVIDDLTLARQLARSGGHLWLGLDDGVESIRPYRRLADLWQMVARSAYTELGCSPVRLAGALCGLLLLFAVPPACVVAGLAGLAGLAGSGGGTTPAVTLGAGALAWALQSASYLPMVRLYRLGQSWAVALPAAGLLYAAMTASSALDYARGRHRWRETPTRLSTNG